MRVSTKFGIMILLMMLLACAALAQYALRPDYLKVCVDMNADYYVQVPQYKYVIINHVNGTRENTTIITGYVSELVRRTIQECDETVGISGEGVDFKAQGYNCKNITGEVICDSCVDGNCDGICSPNGGETCCKVFKNEVVCKNSVVEWTERTHALPVEKLEVR